MRNIWIAALSVAFAACGPGLSGSARAETLQVSNASLIQYAATSDNRVYLRNLGTLNAGWLGCCGAYYIDLTRPAGQAQFSALLSAAALKGPISIYVASASAGGEVLQVGQF